MDENGGLPKGWEWARLQTVCSKVQDGSHFSPKVQYDKPGKDRFPYVTAKNIRNNYL
jgi:type I restriction enzyme S subunit